MKYEKPAIKRNCPYRDKNEWCKKENDRKNYMHLCLQDKKECMKEDGNNETTDII